MYVDYEQTINDKIESSGFLRVKKTFSADDDRGYFETGTIVKAVLKRRNQACFVLKLYPFFESNGYPLLYTPDEDKAVCATFLINGKTNEWFDEWFEVDKEINEVEQNYNKLTENHEKKIDVVVFPIIVSTSGQITSKCEPQGVKRPVSRYTGFAVRHRVLLPARYVDLKTSCHSCRTGDFWNRNFFLIAK